MFIKTHPHRDKFLKHRKISPESSLHMASSKPQSPYQKLFVSSLLLLSFSFVLLVFSFKPNLPFQSFEIASKLHSKPGSSAEWFDFVAGKIGKNKKIKIGLVNVDDHVKRGYGDMHGLVETVDVEFQRVSKTIQWKDLFPEWIDEDHKWGVPSCPEIPMPEPERYRELDVVVAKVPCGGEKSEKHGVRDVFRLQVNLVVANLAVESGWVKPDVNRTVYVVFKGSCGPMREIFRCDDLVTRVGDYWVYEPDLRKLKQMVLMPVGSCKIGPPLAETGKELWRDFLSKTAQLHKLNHTVFSYKKAYATVLHSSETYVCGAIALAQSIRQSGSTNDLILLHDSSISAKSLLGLRAAGWNTTLIQPIRSPFARKGSYNEWNYSKLRVWQLLDYDKIIFIDADIIVTRNIDEFFYYPGLSACSNDKMIFNSGIIILEPSACTFEHLMSKIPKIVSYNGGDQGFLNEVFTWWHRLPSRLNTMKIFLGPKKGKNHEIRNDVYGIHYLGLKPWVCYKDYDCNWDKKDHHIFASDSAHKRWWKVYDEMPKKLQSYCRMTKKMDAKIRKWRGIARNLNLPDQHWKIKVTDPRQHKLSS